MSNTIKDILATMDTLELQFLMDDLSLISDYETDRAVLTQQLMEHIEDAEYDEDDVTDMVYSAKAALSKDMPAQEIGDEFDTTELHPHY